MLNMVLITAALMFGTAGLPHVIVRFYTAKSVRAARFSALWALFFISLLYTTAPSVAAFSKLQIIKDVDGTAVADMPRLVQHLGRRRPDHHPRRRPGLRRWGPERSTTPTS